MKLITVTGPSGMQFQCDIGELAERMGEGYSVVGAVDPADQELCDKTAAQITRKMAADAAKAAKSSPATSGQA